MDLFSIFANLLTLTILEIILGVDNLVFISILCNTLPASQQRKARIIGLMLALIGRLALLSAVAAIVKLKTPLFSILSHNFSVKDLFMLSGGLFLLTKGTWEIHNEFEETPNITTQKNYHRFFIVIFQVLLFDLIFSLDSILTAVGLTKELWIMFIAIIITIFTMIIASEPLSKVINKNPSIKMLALSFLILIGTVLVSDGFGFDIPRGYIYFSVFFSLAVETLNILRSKK